MTGEMGRNDPWFKEFKKLASYVRKNTGLEAEAFPFDQYQGPYILVTRNGRVIERIWDAQVPGKRYLYFSDMGIVVHQYGAYAVLRSLSRGVPPDNFVKYRTNAEMIRAGYTLK